ncbi:MAG: hypothetical protein P8Q92_09940 [Pseudoprimorskyibacter sp.]|nr:hypothetical protein [Pseudoprimorskyibacter sp.]
MAFALFFGDDVADKVILVDVLATLPHDENLTLSDPRIRLDGLAHLLTLAH